MTPFDDISRIHKITFKTLDKHARDSGFEDWKDLIYKNKIERTQSFLIEELIRSALNKFNSEISSNQKEVLDETKSN